MKSSLIISLLCLCAFGSYAQTQNDEAAERKLIQDRAMDVYRETNGNMGPGTEMHYKTNYSNVHAAYPEAPANAVPAWPTGAYEALQWPPCYKYKDAQGEEVMACPGAKFEPMQDEATESLGSQPNENMNVNRENSYMGYYPNLQLLYPQAPANAVPVWPSVPYKVLQNPPCYRYTDKRDREITVCPGIQYEPEHK